MNISNLFRGRINRRNYAVVLVICNICFFAMNSYRTEGLPKEWATLIPTLIILLFLVILNWSVFIRRFHDIGKSGWNVFYFLVPVVGLFLIFYLLFKKGDVDANRYGNSPKPRIDLSDMLPLKS